MPTEENKPNENANAGSSDDANASSQDSNKPMTSAEMLTQLARLQATNERLLEESRKYKSKFSEVKEQKDAEEKARLEEQGKFKDLYEKQKGELEQMKKNMVFKEIKSAVSQEAVKHGVQDPEDLFKLGNASLLQYDEGTGQVVGVSDFLDDLKKRKSYLFSSKPNASVNTMIPNGKTNTQGLGRVTPETLKKLTAEQRTQLLVQKMGAVAKR